MLISANFGCIQEKKEFVKLEMFRHKFDECLSHKPRKNGFFCGFFMPISLQFHKNCILLHSLNLILTFFNNFIGQYVFIFPMNWYFCNIQRDVYVL